jgi:hypothetical protein
MVARATTRLGSIAVLVYGVLAGCGGASFSGDDDGDDGTSGAAGNAAGGTSSGGGGAGGSGATSGTTGSGGSVGGSGTVGGSTSNGGSVGVGGSSGVSGSGGGAGEPSLCFLEPDPGPCRGLHQRWAFDAATGLCLPFTYGGCEGNANNFETPDDCYGACDTGASGAAACSSPTDCTLMRSTCCGCGVPTLGNMIAVNEHQTGAVHMAMGCHLVDCIACDVSDPPLAATCREGHCIAVDLTL